VFVNKNACVNKRRAVLKEMSWFLSEILEVEAVDIDKKHEDEYLFGSSLTRSEAHLKSVASKVANSGAKARKGPFNLSSRMPPRTPLSSWY
jgi:hypothetical protein